MNRAFRDVARRKSTFTNLQSSPKILSASEIRSRFLDYFCEENGHLYIRSSPVFSLKDRTLAFTNAGMNQFKQVFLGIAQPASNRVANSQKCIRISGTHNDLSQVGEDGTHHTFFEMLGNWSFGDYFKEESCRMSWELLTKVFNLSPERLYVTYFKGDQTLGLGPDLEVKEIWRKIGVKDSHILAFGAKENFWTGNVTGPCGPCSEIHYDICSESTDAGFLVNSESNAITELWNLVFTQYDRKPDGTLSKLKTHFVDTGMGFERLVTVLQGKIHNYDTDLFLPLFKVIEEHTGHSGYTGEYKRNEIDTSYRVIADHSRMIAVAISDGMIPNQQHKLRAIMRKTFAIMEKVFNAKEDLLKKLTVCVADSLSDVYPEIEKNLSRIHYIIDEEAEIERKKLADAADRWKKIVKSYPTLKDLDVKDVMQITTGWDYIKKNILNEKKSAFTNEDIFTLCDTHGVPIHQMQQIALKLDLDFNMAAYKLYERSIKDQNKKVIHKKYLHSFNEYPYIEVLSKLEEKKIQPTCDYFKYDYKVDSKGKYIFKEQPTTVEAILYENDIIDELTPEDVKDGKEVGIILDRTNLFSEEGGQATDLGTLEIENDIIFDIDRLVKINNFVIHFGHFRNFSGNSKVSVQNLGTVKINENRRKNIMRNHTALHLLNAALREELNVVAEKHSEVDSDKLLLKFLVYRKFLNENEGIKRVEKYVKDYILHGVSVKRKILTHPLFMSLDDITFIPGESMLGHEIPVIDINSGFKISREFCSGTHVLNTSDIQDFIITKYIKGSYYINTIEAVTGEKCLEIRKTDSELKDKWLDLQKEISNSEPFHPSKGEYLLQKVKHLFSEISDSEMSHLTSLELKNEIVNAKKNLVVLLNTSVSWYGFFYIVEYSDTFPLMNVKTQPVFLPPKLTTKYIGEIINLLTDEIKKASSTTSEKFIVLVLDFPWDFKASDLETATSACNDKPLFIFFRNKEDSFFVQCIVPESFVSEEFSAREWLINSLINYSGTASFISRNLSYYTLAMNSSEAKLLQAVNIAIDFAKKNIKSQYLI